MFYLKRFHLQPFVVASVLLTPLSIGTANAIEIASSPISQNNGTISNTLQKIEKDTLSEYSILEAEKTSQNVTSVSQLSDVKPTDWAFTSLQSLVERYGCIAGYPDRTFRGKKALSRYEFAAGLNACLDKINEIISAGLADKVSKDDLAALKKLQDEFADELAALRGRVDSLEARASTLEAQQFSTTTKLNANVVFAIADTFGGVGTGTKLQNPQQTKDATNTIFGYRARLNFDTSFTGKDLLRTRLQADNFSNFGSSSATNTNMSRLSFDQNSNGTFQIDKFFYRFPIADSLIGFVGASKLDPDDIADTLNPYFESGESGALSRFGRYDPLIFRGPSGAGLGLVYKINPQFKLSASYLANSTASSTSGVSNATGQGGLFNGGYIANAQLVFSPTSDFKFAIAYAHSFEPANVNGSSFVDLAQSTGSLLASQPFGLADTSSNRYGAQFNWQASKGFILSGWLGYATAIQESGGSNNATLFDWGVTFAFPDLFADGNTGGIIFGQPPKVSSNSNGNVDPSNSYLLELEYGFRISKNILITPGIFAVFNPNSNVNNPTTWVATIRTLFSF